MQHKSKSYQKNVVRVSTSECVDAKHKPHDVFKRVHLKKGQELFLGKDGNLFVAYNCLVCRHCPVSRNWSHCTACFDEAVPLPVRNKFVPYSYKNHAK